VTTEVEEKMKMLRGRKGTKGNMLMFVVLATLMEGTWLAVFQRQELELGRSGLGTGMHFQLLHEHFLPVSAELLLNRE
jgi:hypothetical protein